MPPPAGNCAWSRAPAKKCWANPLTFDNTTFFTSFTPGETASECTGGVGINRLYAISVFDGRPRTNFDSPIDEPLTVADRFRTLSTGIPVTDVNLYPDWIPARWSAPARSA